MPRRDPLFRAITPLLVTLALAACGDDGKQTSMTGTMSTTTGAGTTSTGSTTAVETTGTGTGPGAAGGADRTDDGVPGLPGPEPLGGEARHPDRYPQGKSLLFCSHGAEVYHAKKNFV